MGLRKFGIADHCIQCDWCVDTYPNTFEIDDFYGQAIFINPQFDIRDHGTVAIIPQILPIWSMMDDCVDNCPSNAIIDLGITADDDNKNQTE